MITNETCHVVIDPFVLGRDQIPQQFVLVIQQAWPSVPVDCLQWFGFCSFLISEVEDDEDDGEEDGHEAAEDNDGRGDDRWEILVPLSIVS